jgi:hypothetical protein
MIRLLENFVYKLVCVQPITLKPLEPQLDAQVEVEMVMRMIVFLRQH